MAFKKSYTPWNKGLKGYKNAGTFKKGHIGLKGELNGNWKGGKSVTAQGYIEIKKNRKLEHRLIMEKEIGRELSIEEHVHHLDGNKTNNNIKNLIILSRSEHGRYHAIKRWRDNGL